MNQSIYIIGSSHSYQHLRKELSENDHCNFQKLIKSAVSTYNVLLIAEESNLESLIENNIPKSALQLIAEQTGAKHLFTEAQRSYRSENGMKQENDIRAFGFINNLKDHEIEEEILRSYRARECYWLMKILKANIWPVLFVCGANHTVEFYNRVTTTKNLSGILLCKDWGNKHDDTPD